MEAESARRGLSQASTRICEDKESVERIPVVTHTKHSTSVLIAARPDRMRDSLRLLLKTRPEIEIAGHADDDASTLKMVAELDPALMLLNTNLPGEDIVTVLQEIRATGSECRCLVLADVAQQQQAARDAGADVALLKGCSATEFFGAIDGLLAEHGKSSC
jgi:DNA-binding NarL/FixJ family response regulator